MKLVSGHLGEASIPFSVAGTLVRRACNVSTNVYGGDAWPHASVQLPFAELAAARLSLSQKTRGQDGCAPNLSKGARASTPTETTLRLTLLHHLISQLENCPGRKKLLTCSTHLKGTAAKMAALQSILARDRADRRRPAARMAARHSTITVARPYRSDAWAMYPYPEKISFRWYGRMAACVRIFNAKTQKRRAR